MSTERLQKILARAGVAESRRKAEELIREGRVTVNGRVAELGESADPAADAIKVDGKRIHPSATHHYLLVHKPAGMVSTRADPEGRPTVMDLVPAALSKALVTVGRLDYATEGLLLLTDDGDFAQRVAHPRYGCIKTYEVKVKGEPAEDEIDRLRAGILLEGRRTAPTKITRLRGVRGLRTTTQNTWWQVELGEGRTRQIREMFFRIGHPVQRLRRVAIGPLRDPHLRPGAVRELTPEEVAMLSGTATARKEKPAAQKRPRGGEAAKKAKAPKARVGWAKAGGKRSKASRPRGRKGSGGKKA